MQLLRALNTLYIWNKRTATAYSHLRQDIFSFVFLPCAIEQVQTCAIFPERVIGWHRIETRFTKVIIEIDKSVLLVIIRNKTFEGGLTYCTKKPYISMLKESLTFVTFFSSRITNVRDSASSKFIFLSMDAIYNLQKKISFIFREKFNHP